MLLPVPIGLTAAPFIIDDAIVRLAQPLAEAPYQLASGLRRADDFVEKLGRRENFRLNLTGGSSSRTAPAVFEDAHFPDKLPDANPAEKDGIAIEFSKHVDPTAEQAENTVRRIFLSEEDLSFGRNACEPLQSFRCKITATRSSNCEEGFAQPSSLMEACGEPSR